MHDLKRFICSDESIDNKHEYINTQISEGIKVLNYIVKLLYSKAGDAAVEGFKAYANGDLWIIQKFYGNSKLIVGF